MNYTYSGLYAGLETLKDNLGEQYGKDYSSDGSQVTFAIVFGVLFSGVTGKLPKLHLFWPLSIHRMCFYVFVKELWLAQM